MLFLENPGRKRRRKKAATKKRRKRRGRFVKGSAAAKRYMASIRPGAKKKKRTRKRKRAASSTTTKRRTRRRRTTTSTGGTKMARRRKSTRRRKASPRRRRRSYRRNPSMVREVMRGAADGAAVVAGKAATRIVAGKLPMIPKTGALGLVAQLGVAFGVSYLAKFAPAKARAYVRAGAYSAVIEDAVVGLNIPLVSPALDAYPLNAYPSELQALPGSNDGSSLTELDDYADEFSSYPRGVYVN